VGLGQIPWRSFTVMLTHDFEAALGLDQSFATRNGHFNSFVMTKISKKVRNKKNDSVFKSYVLKVF
jgi:hypothetical protein